MPRCTATSNFLPNLGLHACKVSTLTHRAIFPGPFLIFKLSFLLLRSFASLQNTWISSHQKGASLSTLFSLLCVEDTCGLESAPLLYFAYTSCFVSTLSTGKVILLRCKVYGTKNGKLVLYAFLELGIPPFWRAWCVGEEWLCHRCAACTPGFSTALL